MSGTVSANTCRICGNKEGNVLYLAREMMFGLREEFTYFECAQCGCLQIAEFPADMSAYYPDDYYSFSAYDGRKFKGFGGAFNRMKYSFLVSGGGALSC